MTQLRRSAILAAAALLVFVSSPATQDSPQPVPRQAPASPEAPAPPGENFGVLPPPVDMSHIGAEGVQAVGALPASWDWRSHSGVTPVKNQASCGSCWDFAATGALESLVLIRSGKTFDLSEQNMLECNTWGHGCGGGNAWSATGYFTTKGSVLEACDPYQAIKTGNCNTACARVKQVTGWKILPNDVSSIKAAVYQYGPCYTTMYASFPGFSGYDGSYCLYYAGTETINHAVLIVGWDDNMAHAGGSGAWIVKNSWGPTWGASGYFYIAYGSARIGTSSCYYNDYKQYDYLEMMGTLYHYDESGWATSWGYGSATAWGLVKFIPAKDDCLTAVDFWAGDDNMTYDIYIYDTFDGTTTSGLLHSQSGSCPEAGYYSIPLTSPLWVKKGNDFAVVVKFVCTGYNYPVPSDTFSPIETGKCYISPSGSSGSWSDLSAQGDDVSIRARGKNHQYVFDGSDFNNDVASDISIWRPVSGQWFFYGGSSQAWGDEGDIPVNGDYNGDRRTDVAVWRPADGYWYVSGGAVTPWGTRGDIPVPGDYNGNLTTEMAVWRPSDGYWYINGIGAYQWGQAGDIPVPGDYDGNGTTDRAVWRPSDGVWYVSGGSPVPWGAIGDVPVPADYDGDSKVDIAVWRPSNGVWYIKYAAGGTTAIQWGASGDIPAPGDFNGNAAAEQAVWRPSNGVWYVNGGSVYQWGTVGDIPLVR